MDRADRQPADRAPERAAGERAAREARIADAPPAAPPAAVQTGASSAPAAIPDWIWDVSLRCWRPARDGAADDPAATPRCS
jgi:hypothetical protein